MSAVIPREVAGRFTSSLPWHVPIEAAAAGPAVPVWLELDVVASALVGPAVVAGKQIDEEAASGRRGMDADGARLAGEIVQHEQRVIAPVVLHREDVGRVGLDDCPIPPADLGAFLAHPDLPLDPVEQRVWIAPLGFDVDALVAV